MMIKNLFIYPIKSCRGIAVTEAVVTPKGFLWDREFMLVDSRGKFITQRTLPQMATIEVKIENDQIVLSSPSVEPFSFKPTQVGPEIAVEIWRDRTIAIDQGDSVAMWLSKVLKFADCRLVKQSPDHLRSIDINFASSPNQPVSFADGYPFLLIGTASLEELNNRLINTGVNEKQVIPLNRFRPNLVVETTKPFVEGDWQVIQIGEVSLKLVKPCERCIVTTTDQITGERNKSFEPLKTLATFRRKGGGVFFGENLVPLNRGIIKIGDRLQVSKTQE